MIFKKVKQVTKQAVSLRENEVLLQLRGLEFWIWDKEQHRLEFQRTEGKCCWNHTVPAGLPIKDGIVHTLYQWQKPIIDALLDDEDSSNNNLQFFQRRHLALLKARGSGGSELGLRIMMYLATKDNKLSGSEMAIISGNSSLLSIALVDRAKKLFWNDQTNQGITFDTKESVLEINGVRLESYMSHRIEGLRGRPNLSFGMADESSKWPLSEQQPVLDALLGYVPKSRNFRLFLLSTAGYPGDLMDKIFQQPEQECLFQRVRVDWRTALGTILEQSELDKIRLTSQNTWLREFELQFAGFAGNVYTANVINQCVKNYNLDKIDVAGGGFSMGVDLGSTTTGITLAQWNQVDRKVYIILSEERQNWVYSRILYHIMGLINTFNPEKVYVDASNSFLIRDLKNWYKEEAYAIVKDRVKNEYKDIALREGTDREYDVMEKYMSVVPVAWTHGEGTRMLQHSKYLMESNKVRIHSHFDKLITSLRTAYTENDRLNKDLTLHDDVYDSYILALRRFRK